MKKILLLAMVLVGALMPVEAKEPTVNVYCELVCLQYNLFKYDVNVRVDFGVANKASHSVGWIYNTTNNKKKSFASNMSVLNYMAVYGWKYLDYYETVMGGGPKAEPTVTKHYIMTKEVPVDYTANDVIGDIDYREN